MDRTAPFRLRLARFVTPLAIVVMLSGSAAAGQSGFVYALQDVAGASLIHGFRLDQTTGALTPLPGFPVSSGGNGLGGGIRSEQLTYHNGRLYVVNDGSNTLTVFDVNAATGVLTAPFAPVALGAGEQKTCVAVHPSGSPVVIGASTGSLESIVISGVTATPAAGSPFSTGAAIPFSCRFSQTGAHVYTGGGGGTTAAGFSVNPNTGVLTALAGSPFAMGMNMPLGYATDSSGRLFATSFSAAEVRVFTTTAGVPTAVTGNPFASGLTQGIHGILHRGGFYMVADRAGARVGVYQIAGTGAATTLTPVAGSPFTTGASRTISLALSSTGGHLVAADEMTRNLTVFQVNQSTGVLSMVSVQAANTLGTTGIVSGLVFAPGEVGFIYALQDVNGGANRMHGYRINPATGGMIPIPGLPINSGGTGSAMTNAEMIAYRNGRLYVVNDGNDTLTAFKVNRTTGALTALFSPIALGGGIWRCVAVHPSGSPVVVGRTDGALASYDVSATSATSAAGSPFGTGGAGPTSCAFSRDGTYVYTGGNSVTTIAGFSVNAETGVLVPLAGSPFNSGATFPAGYATDTAGRLFIADASATQVRVFTTSAGVPTGVSGNPFASGTFSGFFGLLHPSGFYAVTDIVGFQVGVYRIDGSGAATTLTAVSGSPFQTNGSFPLPLALTEDGAFLIAANGASRNLSGFRFNFGTGELTLAGVQAADTLGATGRITGMAFAAVIPPFLDDPLTALTSVVKALHITELRTRIDAVRAQYGLGPFAYNDPTLTVGTTVVRAAHLIDLRTALADVYIAIGMTLPSYTDPGPTIGTTVVKVAHIAELRAAVLAVE